MVCQKLQVFVDVIRSDCCIKILAVSLSVEVTHKIYKYWGIVVD